MVRKAVSLVLVMMVVLTTLAVAWAADIGPKVTGLQGGSLGMYTLSWTLSTNQAVSGRTQNRAIDMKYCRNSAAVIVTAGAGTTNITCTIIDDGATIASPTISLTTAGEVKKVTSGGTPTETLELDCVITDGTIADVTVRCN